MPRHILHVDMDAFFASVEQLDDPGLRGKPVLVGGDGPRGVVAAASYEARRFGCRSAQPMAIARRRCPDAIVVHPRGKRYREVSRQVFEILESYTPLVQPLSIDEAFLDVTGSTRLHGAAPEIARSIKTRIKETVGVTASVGVAWCKFLAKLASEWDKPDGLTVLRPEDVDTRVAARPVTDMWGVGPAMAARLARFNVRTFGDLQRMTAEEARRQLGDVGVHFRALARGEDERGVTPDGRAKSVSNEQTFGVDIRVPAHVRQILLGQCEHIAMRLRRHDLVGRTVVVKIRYGEFETITRSATLAAATHRTERLWAAGASLFDRWASTAYRPVRLIGIGVSNLSCPGGEQLELLPDRAAERADRLDAATDEIRRRFGAVSIHRGITYTDGSS